MLYSSADHVHRNQGLDQWIQNIVMAVSPDKIFFKGHFLLIVISNHSQRPNSELRISIEATGIPPIYHYVICNLAVLENDLNHGHLFYSTLCTPEHLVYDSGTTTLPLPLIPRAQKIRESATHDFMSGYQRAQSFLKGASFFIANEEPRIAAFMLHQAAEQGMRALRLAVYGQDVKTHNLAELHQQLKKHGQQINTLFNNKNEREQYLSDRLEKAYICARYSDFYKVSPDELFDLQMQVRKLLQELKSSFDELILLFTQTDKNYFLSLNLAL